MRPKNDGIEDTEYFLLLCPSFDMKGQDLARVTDLLMPFVEKNLPSSLLVHLLFYGDQNLLNDLNKNIIELTLRFIRETGRFK